MSASVYRTVLDCMRMQYSALSACMHPTSSLSVGVCHIIQSYVCRRIPYNACLQVYAIQRYICGHVPYVAFVCRCVPYHTELCLQVCTVQCLSAGVCHTALCLRACTNIALVCRCIPYRTEPCLRAYTIQCLSAGLCNTSHVCGHVPYIALVGLRACGFVSYRAMSAGVYRTVLVYRCVPYSSMSAGMNPTSRLSVRVYHTALCLQVYAIQRYVCGYVPYIALVCRSIPYSACPQVYAYTPYGASCTSCCYASVPHRAGLQVSGSMLHLRTAGMHENHIVPDCGHVGLYHIELCLQAYTVQCLSTGVCHTALCLRA